MAKYEVQFLGKSSKQWVCYDFTEAPQVALDRIEFLNSIGYDARIITYEIVSKEIHEYYIEKEVNKCEK